MRIGLFILVVMAMFSSCQDENSPPVADFIVSSYHSDTLTVFEFDASLSSDAENPGLALAVRWDWENDGIWDTNYNQIKKAAHRYRKNGKYHPKLEVLDQEGMVDTCSRMIHVTDVRKDSSIIDPRDGRQYPVVLIEDVWWMAKNLDYGIQILSDSYPIDNNLVEKYYLFDSDSLGQLYGGLYTWDEAMDRSDIPGSQGVCPPGWQIPEGYYVSALWDLGMYPYPDHKLYYGVGGYLGIDLERSGFYNKYGNQEYLSLAGMFWMSERKLVNGQWKPFSFSYAGVFYINNPDYTPQNKFSAFSIRCIQPVK